MSIQRARAPTSPLFGTAGAAERLRFDDWRFDDWRFDDWRFDDWRFDDWRFDDWRWPSIAEPLERSPRLFDTSVGCLRRPSSLLIAVLCVAQAFRGVGLVVLHLRELSFELPYRLAKTPALRPRLARSTVLLIGVARGGPRRRLGLLQHLLGNVSLLPATL
jgi:hypothetical protein